MGKYSITGRTGNRRRSETNLIQKESAKARKEFEKWCVTRIGGLPNEKMGADGGIDGRILLLNNKIAIISVKSGSVGVSHIRELKGLLNGKNKIGIFITKEHPTKPMRDFAKQAGIYQSTDTLQIAKRTVIPKVQILTLEQILRGEQPVLP